MTKKTETPSGIFRNESGNVFILIAFSLIMMVTGIAVAVDMTRAFLVRSKAQSALDAALIGASSIAHKGITPKELKDRATEFLEANFPPGYMGTPPIKGGFKVAFDEANGTVSGSLTLPFSPAFDNILSAGKIDLHLNGEVTRILGKDIEISLALDHTSSMCAPINCSGACPQDAPCTGAKGNSRINVLADSVQILVDEMTQATDAAKNPDSKVLYAYVPFNHDVKINGNVMHFAADYLPNSVGLREDATPIVNAMKAVNIEDEGNTNAAKGLAWGWRALRPDDKGLFPGTSSPEFADHPKPPEDDNTIKALILLSDGENMFTYFGKSYLSLPGCSPYGCPEFPDWQHPIPSADRGNEHANYDQEELCAAILKEGIRIFPIVLNGDTSSPQWSEVKRINDGCATPPRTEAYYPKTAEELRVVFRQIARELINLRITK